MVASSEGPQHNNRISRKSTKKILPNYVSAHHIIIGVFVNTSVEERKQAMLFLREDNTLHRNNIEASGTNDILIHLTITIIMEFCIAMKSVLR